MSYTETHFGKAKKIEFPSQLSFEEKVDYLKGEGFEFDEVYPEDGYAYCEKLALTPDGVWYEFIEHEKLDESESRAIRNTDGTITFFLSFYNGGCSFEEELSDAIKKARGKK